MSEVLKEWIRQVCEPLVIYTDYEPTVPLDLSQYDPVLFKYADAIEAWQGPYHESDIFVEILKEVEEEYGSSDRSAEAQANEADA